MAETPRDVVFVSSRMEELRAERAQLRTTLAEVDIDAWVYEDSAGAQPVSIEQAYLTALASADIFVGIYGIGYGKYTAEEFEEARRRGKPCLLYEKKVPPGQRDQRLEEFLQPLRDVPSGLARDYFDDAPDLASKVRRDTLRVIRRLRSRPQGPPLYMADHDGQKSALRPDLRQAGPRIVLVHGGQEQAHRTLSSYCFNEARQVAASVREMQRLGWPPDGPAEDRFETLCERILNALDQLDAPVARRGAAHAEVLRRLSSRRDRPSFRLQLARPNAKDRELLDRSLEQIWGPVADSGTEVLVVIEFVHSPWWFWGSPSYRSFSAIKARLEVSAPQARFKLSVPPRIVSLPREKVRRISASVHGSNTSAEAIADEAYRLHGGRVGPTLKHIYEVEDDV